MTICPEASFPTLSLSFKPGKLGIVRCVLTNPPGKASSDQFVIQISTIREQDRGHSSPVAVFVPRSNLDNLAEGES